MKGHIIDLVYSKLATIVSRPILNQIKQKKKPTNLFDHEIPWNAILRLIEIQTDDAFDYS